MLGDMSPLSPYLVDKSLLSIMNELTQASPRASARILLFLESGNFTSGRRRSLRFDASN
jgi:hypothetical protein